MTLCASYQKHILKFKFDAGTSRAVLKEHTVYYLKVWDETKPEIIGIGEAAPLKGLSIDYREDFEEKIDELCKEIYGIYWQAEEDWLLDFAENFVPDNLPALRFALEVALLDLSNGGKRRIFKNGFYEGTLSLPINGLIWMGEKEFMMQQIEDKLTQGFKCIKLKIGAIDFEQELALLDFIRAKYSPEEITLRVDANGAFAPSEALAKLEALAERGLHSIEQPIAAHQEEEMEILCQKTPLPIALDEELIGIQDDFVQEDLLKTIKPQFIILKPTLLGGISASKKWIALAQKLKIDWWITSALESNIGLNAICQLAAEYPITLPQGLGTGGLYENNIFSPLEIKKDQISYNLEKKWNAIL